MDEPVADTTYAVLFAEAWCGYAAWLWRDLTHPGWGSYTTLLVVVTGVFLVWEQLAPWRPQPRLREGFWLDASYVAFNFFLFSLLGFQAAATVASAMVADGLGWVGVASLPVVVRIDGWPTWSQLAVYLVVRDHVQYWIHRLLHRAPLLWRFHAVHHSARQLGVTTNLRFHFAETVVYRALELVPLAMIGFGVEDLFLVHALGLVVGHWNHANVRLPLGPLRYLLNSPQVHVWHHVKALPTPHGANFGVVFSLWDHLFGTAWAPHDGRDLALGFHRVEDYPRSFAGQLLEPFRGDPARGDG